MIVRSRKTSGLLGASRLGSALAPAALAGTASCREGWYDGLEFRLGDENSWVGQLQNDLATLGYDVARSGTYNASTAAAIRHLERWAGVPATGVFAGEGKAAFCQGWALLRRTGIKVGHMDDVCDCPACPPQEPCPECEACPEPEPCPECDCPKPIWPWVAGLGVLALMAHQS